MTCSRRTACLFTVVPDCLKIVGCHIYFLKVSF
uniref:Uncharacterized protein n=1 Tax=Lepeophtheirus salmonis TaxID=72036 RepID=A0A0K2UQE6_LEPSM